MSPRQFTAIRDYAGQSKGNDLETLMRVFRVSDEGVTIAPDPNRAYDYEVIIGRSYYACTYNVLPPAAN